MEDTRRLSEVIDMADPAAGIVADALANHAEELEYRADCDDFDARRLGMTEGCPGSHELRRQAHIARDLLRELDEQLTPHRARLSG